MSARLRFAACALAVLLVPSATWSQDSTSGTITGVVRDASGAVLPGVTVEASSPALIEKVRVGTTDSDGRFRLIDLRPGEYVVTFTLTGFRTLRREGIQLTTGFTATVNADHRHDSLRVQLQLQLQYRHGTVLARGGREQLVSTPDLESRLVDVSGNQPAAVSGWRRIPRRDAPAQAR
jgi:hypothetical protein